MKKDTKSRPLLPEDTPREKSGRPSRFDYFGFDLYPDCDEHMQILEYIRKTLSQIMDCAWILHDKDRWDKDVADGDGNIIHYKGDPKKAHYHVVYHPSRSTIAGQIKFWGGILDHIEGINNIQGQMLYLVHWDFPSKINEYKFEYSLDELHCCDKWKAFLVGHNAHFAQLDEIFDVLEKSPHGSLVDLFHYLRCSAAFENSENMANLTATLARFQGLICTASNQIHALRKRQDIDSCADMINEQNFVYYYNEKK